MATYSYTSFVTENQYMKSIEFQDNHPLIMKDDHYQIFQPNLDEKIA